MTPCWRRGRRKRRRRRSKEVSSREKLGVTGTVLRRLRRGGVEGGCGGGVDGGG